MVSTIVINGTGVLTNAEASGNFFTVTIGAESDETDFYLQGTQCVSAQASKKAGELYYDCATDFGRALDFDVAGTEEGQLLYMWIGCTTLGVLQTIANNGLSIRIATNLIGGGDATNDWEEWTIAGNDDLRNFRGKKGGFICFALDPRLSPSASGGALFDIGNINYIGVHIETTAASKTQNVMIDTIAVGFGVQITATDASGWADTADYCTNYGTRAWGMIQYDDSKRIIYSMGKILIGDSAQGAPTSLTDDSRNIVFIQTEYYVAAAWTPMVSNAYLGYDFEDAAGANFTTFTDGVIVGAEKGRSGSNIFGSTAVTTYFDATGLTNGSSIIKLYNTKLLGIDYAVNLENDANHQYLSCVFDNCAEINFGGANPNIRNCIFSNTAGASALLWYSGIDISDCSFINNSVAIRFPIAGFGYAFDTMSFSGNTVDIENEANATLVDSTAAGGSDQVVGNGVITAAGQSFTAIAGVLSSAYLRLKTSGAPAGNAVAKLYSSQGADPNRTPLALLAISNNVDVATIGAGYGDIYFEFEDEYTLIVATTYFIVLEFDDGVADFLHWEYDNADGEPNNNFALYQAAAWGDVALSDGRYSVNHGGIVKIGLTDSNPVLDDNSGTPKGATIMPISKILTIRGVKTDEEPNDYVRCAIYCTAGGDLTVGTELMNEEAQTVDDLNAGFFKATEAFTYTNDQPIRYVARHENYEVINLTATITIDGLDVKPPWIENEIIDLP